MLGLELRHSLYLFAAIGFGVMVSVWMRDSGFRMVGRLSGGIERVPLLSSSVITTVNRLAGLRVSRGTVWMHLFTDGTQRRRPPEAWKTPQPPRSEALCLRRFEPL